MRFKIGDRVDHLWRWGGSKSNRGVVVSGPHSGARYIRYNVKFDGDSTTVGSMICEGRDLRFVSPLVLLAGQAD